MAVQTESALLKEREVPRESVMLTEVEKLEDKATPEEGRTEEVKKVEELKS